MMNNVQHSELPGHTVASLTVRGTQVRVHAFLCGTVTVKRCHHTGVLPESAPSALRFAAILADRAFAEPMPIWAYAIELPTGVVVIDAGADPTYADQASWNGHQASRRLLHSFIKLRLSPDEALPARMETAGIDRAAVTDLVLTHQHIDHTGTVPAFPNARVWTTAAEDAAARSMGAEHWRWRTDHLDVRYVEDHGRHGPIGLEVDLVGDGSLLAAHTPGHTPGSVTVRLVADGGEVLFTGDTSFTAEAMDPAAPTAGIHTDMRAVRRLQAALRHRGTLLPSHDPGVPARLAALSAAGTS